MKQADIERLNARAKLVNITHGKNSVFGIVHLLRPVNNMSKAPFQAELTPQKRGLEIARTPQAIKNHPNQMSSPGHNPGATTAMKYQQHKTARPKAINREDIMLVAGSMTVAVVQLRSNQNKRLQSDNGQDNRVRRNSSSLQTRMIEHSGPSVCYTAFAPVCSPS
ncbi:hypothetical protein SAMN06265222_12510 [Neorhodopirellula lusitana]|uniref:Uncharacterized protein n=1 Tax=Neorhodopirellula lusitana TaxID=445327 RepID=A0ABY1QRB6_9BACT|nr:hypothetical protein SAMN06265222_12510 [Neorhodopirellula lusitana]